MEPPLLNVNVSISPRAGLQTGNVSLILDVDIDHVQCGH